MAVASFAEAWIEIDLSRVFTIIFFVASFAEAWIEISSNNGFTAS